jgi:hypothetical protein
VTPYTYRMSLRRVALLLLFSLSAFASSYTLYDGSLGTVPSAQGWASFTIGSTETLGAGAVTLDSTAVNGLHAGYGLLAPISLDATVGFDYTFTVRVNSESHSSNDRAGFSAIVITSNLTGIELGFWQTDVWAQNVGFTHGEDAAFDTTSGLIQYDLLVQGTSYTLYENTTALLSGSLRDYSGSAIPPYTVANSLFLGDDTTSAKGSFSLSAAGLSAPEPGAFVLLASGLAALLLRRTSRT